MSSRVVLFGFQPRLLTTCVNVLKAQKDIWLIDPEALTNDPLDREVAEHWLRDNVRSDLSIHWVCHADMAKLIFDVQDEISHVIKQRQAALIKSPGFRLIAGLYGDQASRAIQLKLASARMLEVLYLKRVLEHMRTADETMTVISGVWDELGLIEELDWVARPAVSKKQSRSKHLRRLALLPVRLAWLMRIKGKGLAFSSIPKFYKLGVEVIWAHTTQLLQAPKRDGYMVNELRSRWSNFYLQDYGNANPHDLLYVADHYNFDRTTLPDFKQEVAERGSAFADFNELPTHIKTLAWALFAVLPSALFRIFTAIFQGPKAWVSLEVAFQALSAARDWENFCRFHRPRVMLGIDDQMISHIARTMVFEKYGLKSVGIHHSTVAGAALVPSIGFVHYHRQYRYGSLMKELFAGLWDEQDYVDVGPIRGDLIKEAEDTPTRKQQFEDMYGGKFNILVAPPGKHVWNLEHLQDAFFETLIDVAKANPNVRLILRPRPAFKPPEKSWAKIQEAINAGQLVLETTNFDTWELIAYCDLVLCNFTSMIQEALQAGKPVLTFSFNTMTDAFIYYRKCPDMVATMPQDLKQRLQAAIDAGGHVTDQKDEIEATTARDLYGQSVGAIVRDMTAMSEAATQQNS